jgi:hypothetical protein
MCEANRCWFACIADYLGISRAVIRAMQEIRAPRPGLRRETIHLTPRTQGMR